MFRKPFHIKTSVMMRSSDQRKLRQRILAQIGAHAPALAAPAPAPAAAPRADADTNADSADADATSKQQDRLPLWDEHEALTITKVVTFGGDPVTIYTSTTTNQPLLFELDSGLLVPTVYMLWRIPALVPTFVTSDNAFERIENGADLMLPGVIVRRPDLSRVTVVGRLLDVQHLVQELEPISIDQVRGVTILGNGGAAVCVGRVVVDAKQIQTMGPRGKALEVLHTMGDQLWLSGGKGKLPQLPDPFVASLEEDDLDFSDDEEEEEEAESSSASSSASSAPAPAAEEPAVESSANSSEASTSGAAAPAQEDDIDHDALLETCFFHALKTLVEDKQLPITNSVLFSTHMLACRPPDVELDLKKTKYKKVSKFFQEMQKRGVIKLKEYQKGVESLASVNRAHPDLVAFVVPVYKAKKKTAAVVEEDEPNVSILELYGAWTAARPIFTEYHEELLKEHGDAKAAASSSDALPVPEAKAFHHFGKEAVYTASEARDALSRYFVRHKLIVDNDRRMINIDPQLADLLLTKEERASGVSRLARDDLTKRLLTEMRPYHRLDIPGDDPVVRKHRVKHVLIRTEKRVGRKLVTVINHADLLEINLDSMAKQLSKLAAASAAVTVEPNGSRVVVVQGDAASAATNYLVTECRVPKKYIQFEDKVSKKH